MTEEVLQEAQTNETRNVSTILGVKRLEILKRELQSIIRLYEDDFTSAQRKGLQYLWTGGRRFSTGNVLRRPISSKRNLKQTITRKVYVERTKLVFGREKFMK